MNDRAAHPGRPRNRVAPRRRAAAALGALALGLVALLPARADTTGSGNAGLGQTEYNASCAVCHGVPPGTPNTTDPPRYNAANAGDVIDRAIAAGLMAPVGTFNTANIGAYLNTLLPAMAPVNVAFGGSAPITFNTITLASTVNTMVTTTSPTKGSLGAYAGNTVTYTHDTCQTGSDTVAARATVGAGPGPLPAASTAPRTVTVNIGLPTNPPAITSSATAPPGQTGVAYAGYTIAATNCPTSYSVSAGALPPGLGLNPTTGQVTGTPTAVGNFNATLAATNAGALTGTLAVSFSITLGPPVVTSAATAPAGAVGIAYPGYTVTATNSPTSFSVAPGVAPAILPPGLALDGTTGQVTGTPTAAGTFTPTLRATNGTGTGGQAVTFVIAVGAPVVTPSTFSGQTGVAFADAVVATNGPTGYAVTAGALPPGIALNPATGQLTGTPTAVGTFTPTIQATNGTGSGSAVVTFNITLGPPVITSALSASAGVAVAFSYAITATNSPSSFNATGLPPGLAVNTGTGVISGAPTAAGSFNVTISATNGVPLTGTATLVINVATVAPIVTSPTTASGQTGVAFTYQITAINGPTSFDATPLPPGLSVNTATGLISGIPAAIGTFNLTVSASNGAGTFPQPTVFTITLGPPVITSPATAGGAATVPFTYQITALNNPTSFGATGLPPGLSVNPATGLISGTPTTNGTFAATVSATNATGTSSLAVTITIAFGAPVITSPASAAGATGQPFSYQITASGGPTSYNATGLPAGLSVNTATGLISGTPAATGTSSVTLSATNGTGTGTLVLALTISLSAPVITSPASAGGTVGQPFTYQIAATNGPTSFAATGLPPGLALDAATGVISGTPTAGGTFGATVSATNATGTATQGLAITIVFVAPAAGNLSVNVAFQVATAINLPITGQFTQVNIVTPPANGTLSVPVPGSATVTYTPASGYSGPDSFTYTATGPGGTSAVATVTITVPTFRPVVATVAMTVPVNTPTTLDLSPFIVGSGVTGVSIPKTAAHGTVAVAGTTVTYTPKQDFFGADSFTYVAYGNAGTSEPGVVNVNVIGRPDPSKNATVVGLLEAQAQTARRFARAQLSNYQRRLESLHVGPPDSAPEAPDAPPGPGTPPAPAKAATGRDTGAAAASAAAAQPGATSAPAGLVKTALANTLVSAAATQSVSLAASTDGTAGRKDGTNAWVGGVAHFGRRSLEEEGASLKFSTDGVSVGADRRFSDRLALGLGLGYARDRTDIGTDGSRSKSEGASFAGYGSYQPSRHTFVDAVLGFGTLDMDSDRYVASVEEFATGRRKGTQVFGSLAAGYEARREGVLFSPYGRVDFSVDRLKQATESGAGLNALTYHEQTLKTVQAAAGVRLETQHRTDFGWAMPRVRLEFRHDFDGGRTATLSYADLFGGLTYSVTPSGTSRNALLFGVGSDFLLRGGMRIGVDYQGERISGSGTSQAVRLLFSQDLDGKGLPSWPWEWNALTDPVGVEAGYAFDDNVSRGLMPDERISDQVYTLGLNASRTFPINDNLRVIATGLLNVDKYHEYTGLGRTSGGLQGEVQYRASGDFDATTWTLYARGWLDGYESRLRSGQRLSVGANARRSLTDRIDLFGEVGANWRYAESEVFEGRDYGAKFNVDYSLGRHGTLYLAGEYRRGDTFSSGFASLTNVSLADVFVRDDAFETLPFYAYRLEARAVIGTLGYNRPLGPRDSLDFSWRRVRATPVERLENAGSLDYTVNQYSILYLMRF